jgi:hypothetical protein
MGTPKIIVTLNRDAWNAQVTTWQTNATVKKDRAMPDVSSVVETILRITRDVRSTRAYKRKHIHLFVWNNTPLLHGSNRPYTLNQSNICSNNQTKFLCCRKYRARSTHKPTSSANQRYKKNSMVWVRERTIPTERPPPLGEVFANFCG